MNGRPIPARVPPVAEVTPSADGFVELDGELYARIVAYDRLQPFLMSVPGDTDLWMFVASGGGLTAGRGDADGALFPYETVDRLHDAHHFTGPVTVMHVEAADGSSRRWEPFLDSVDAAAAVERTLYKNATGNRVVFEEFHPDLQLAFRYRWAASDSFGWVRTATLENRGSHAVRIRLMDGLRNILPWGAPLSLYQQASTLVDAYKKSEIEDETGLGIYSLTSRITDRTEPMEALRANTVWCCGLEDARLHLSTGALDDFRRGRVVAAEWGLDGTRGNYLVSTSLFLGAGERTRWHICGDTGQDHRQIAHLRRRILSERHLAAAIDGSLDEASRNLRRNVASADGLQLCGHTATWVHHFANVLFNNMRGGVFADNDEIGTADLASFLRTRNTAVAARHEGTLAALPPVIAVEELLERARQTGDADFERLCSEYMPLHFSRRHGDPSRPWNRFSIRVRNDDGSRALNFEGNWRDIFQNWEALATAFPGFLTNMVSKFVNASTVDGFNPYRITRDGVEWEVPAPEDPWSNIGYWGDHQVIYLLKLLEALDRHDPGAFDELLGREVFTYVEVPYRIAPYEQILADPRHTIEYDEELAGRISRRVGALGQDGQLLTDPAGGILHVNLLEKLLVPVLSKLSNLVPEAGIWMNTQRPEWNDANNALGGGGVSVVTLCYLRRYLDFVGSRLARSTGATLTVSREVAEWFAGVEAALARGRSLLAQTGTGPQVRREIMDALGQAFSDYRATVYARGLGEKTDLETGRVIEFFRTALHFVDLGIGANRRADGLYHTYNRLDITARGVEIGRLPEMLEGQVAVLSSGLLDPQESRDLLERLFDSALYSPTHRSFLLYPDRELPGFLRRNVVPTDRVRAIGLLGTLMDDGETAVLARDADGVFRFHGDLANARDLQDVLDRLAGDPRWTDEVARDREAVLGLFEEVFDHKSYTGRSGVMYGYEGLGCVYWHMVAKLLLAAQEQCLRAVERDHPAALQESLADLYFRIRSGIGYEKTAAEYGAFPTDPYSHTPADGGARQPGMTGQVKEEILTRRGELGVRVHDGIVRFEPSLLRECEWLAQPARFDYYDVGGAARSLDLPARSLAFTLCQIPVVYQAAGGPQGVEVDLADGTTVHHPRTQLDRELSRELFARSGRLLRIRVGIDPARAAQR